VVFAWTRARRAPPGWANASTWGRVLDYEPDEMVSDPNFWFDHIHPDDVPQIFSSLA
jgi:hypothetical protein